MLLGGRSKPNGVRIRLFIPTVSMQNIHRVQTSMKAKSHNNVVAAKPPFLQTDIIGAMVIVWRVRGKTISSALCNIVRNNCAQCNAHTYEQT